MVSSWDGEKQSDVGSIFLKMKLSPFANTLHVGYRKNRGLGGFQIAVHQSYFQGSKLQGHSFQCIIVVVFSKICFQIGHCSSSYSCKLFSISFFSRRGLLYFLAKLPSRSRLCFISSFFCLCLRTRKWREEEIQLNKRYSESPCPFSYRSILSKKQGFFRKSGAEQLLYFVSVRERSRIQKQISKMASCSCRTNHLKWCFYK